MFFNIYYCVSISTINQITKKKSRRQKIPPFSRATALTSRPQIKGIVARLATMTPKKPNSAIRHVAKVRLTNDGRVTARMPGIGYLCVKYNRVLVRGGRANDLPGVRFSLVRGVYDFSSVLFKKKRRSIYGAARPDNYTSHVRRCFRSIGL